MSFASDNARAQRKAKEKAQRAVNKEYREIKKHFRRVEESLKAKATAHIDAKIKEEKNANHKRLVHPRPAPSRGSGPPHAHAARRGHRTGEVSRRSGEGDSGAQRTSEESARGNWQFIRTKRQSPRR